MKRLALAAVLVSVACVAFAADEPTTVIKLSFSAEHVKGHEADGKAAWEAFCATVGTNGGQWRAVHSSMPTRGDNGVGVCVLSLTNAQFSAMLDALRILMANPAFQHCYTDFRVTSER